MVVKKGMKNYPRRSIMFSDEKNWHVDMHINCWNTRYLAKKKTDVHFVAKNKFLAKAMSFGLVGTDSFVFQPM